MMFCKQWLFFVYVFLFVKNIQYVSINKLKNDRLLDVEKFIKYSTICIFEIGSKFT